ncbi:MAG: energy transducer TonB [Gammaproteobacteria bacterium]|nr:MotA/TolQ/ExbB proton channel family protein [Gammaproteobacteria bacterium]NNC97964.1 energy transducer TonB [Gammaproteobacteria bacterium]NNM13773.1 energy transducer TonB [Gammaproteobacteria bacterium]
MKTSNTNILKKLGLSAAAAVLSVSLAMPAFAAQSVNLDQLLQLVRQGEAQDRSENQQRLAEFRANRNQQANLLKQVQSQQAAAEAESNRLNRQFEVNDQEIIDLNQKLDERLGDLKELFGVLQQAAGDTKANFDSSITSPQFPEREAYMADIMTKMGQTSKFASMSEIEQLWAEMMNEMIQSGKVAKFTAPVTLTDGSTQDKTVTRFGTFNVVADGKYLKMSNDRTNYIELPRQPQSRFSSKVGGAESASSGLSPLAVDITRGGILETYTKRPTLIEKVKEGKEVGYVIIGLGIIGVLLAIWRFLALMGTSAAVSRQVKNTDKPGNNPLGRVLKVYKESDDANTETLELRLSEAVLKETPKLNRMLSFLKIIAVVAPLLGLLGTVTGMINTFQAIQLYGTGDPKLMAGGISQALVTTVLGLCVAIPMVFLHSIVASKAKGVSEVITQQAAGMIAERAEQTS